jgi:hypothetical protein
MQKAGFGQTDIDKSCLHARKNFRHTSSIDIANETVVSMSLNEQFRRETLFKQRYARFTCCGVHNNVDQ